MIQRARRPDDPRHPGGAPPLSHRGRLAALAVLALLALGALAFWLGVRAFRDLARAGPEWSFPAIVYSDRLPLAPGAALSEAGLEAQLAARGYVRAKDAPAPGTWSRDGARFEVALRGFVAARDPDGAGGPERVRLAFEDGRLARVERLGALGRTPPDTSHAPALEPVRVGVFPDTHRVMRAWTPLARIPKVMRDAVISAEDRRFYTHPGVDGVGLTRAVFSNLKAGGVREGGSTLTQQLARGLWLGPERSVRRKLLEAALATGLELCLSKDEILEMYLNSVYLGRSGSWSVAGVGEASRWYFSVPPESLSLAQAALLAGMIPAPNLYNPVRRPEQARARRNAVLSDMVAAGRLDSASANVAKRLPLGLDVSGPPRSPYPSYTDAVRAELSRTVSKRVIETHGLAVFTRLDPVWQASAQADFPKALAAVEGGGAGARLQGAFVALEPATASVRALLGGRALGAGEFNRALWAKRQPGSAAKPFVYAAAIEAPPPLGLAPDSVVSDLPGTFETGGARYSPRNSHDEYHERVTLAYALAQSLNLATVRIVERIRPQAIVPYFEKLGLGKPKPVLSLGLGSQEVTPLALAAAYGAFANDGVWREPTTLRAVARPRGRPIALRAPATRPVFRPETALLVRGMMEGVVQTGTGGGARVWLGAERALAGKTGTTNDEHDGWFVGFTPEILAAVWVGYDDPRSLARSSSGSAVPVWGRLVRRLLANAPPSSFPETPAHERITIDAWTGRLARAECPRRINALLPKLATRRLVCDRDHARDWLRIWFGDAADSVAFALGDSALRDSTLVPDSLARFLGPEAPGR